jgi:hypothetical protein
VAEVFVDVGDDLGGGAGVVRFAVEAVGSVEAVGRGAFRVGWGVAGLAGGRLEAGWGVGFPEALGEEGAAAHGAEDAVVGLDDGVVEGEVGAVDGAGDGLLPDEAEEVEADVDGFLDDGGEELVGDGVLLGEEVIDGGWFDELHGTNIEQAALEVKPFLWWRRVDPAPALSPRAGEGGAGCCREGDQAGRKSGTER